MSENNNKKMLSKKKKKIIIAITAVTAVIAAFAVIVAANYTFFSTRVIYALMPKSTIAETDSGSVEYHIRLKDSYDSKEVENNPMLAFEYYTYDENGEKIYLDSDASYSADGMDTPVFYLFGFRLIEKIGPMKSTATTVLWVLAAAAVVVMIVVWYILWARKEDAQKAEKYKNQNLNKKKQKRK